MFGVILAMKAEGMARKCNRLTWVFIFWAKSNRAGSAAYWTMGNGRRFALFWIMYS